MKQILCCAIAAIAISSTAQAQEPNSIFVSGSGQYINHYGQYQINADIGYQFCNKWTVGGSVSKGDYGGTGTFTNFSVGGFTRFTDYIAHSKRFFWYAQAGAGFAGSVYEQSTLQSYEKSTFDGMYVSLSPGIGIKLGRGFAMNFSPGSVQYRTGDYKTMTSTTKLSTIDAGFGVRPTFGLTKNFRLRHVHHADAPAQPSMAPETAK
jgi:hypothetical protein